MLYFDCHLYIYIYKNTQVSKYDYHKKCRCTSYLFYVGYLITAVGTIGMQNTFYTLSKLTIRFLQELLIFENLEMKNIN